MKHLRSSNLTFPVSSVAGSAKLFHPLCFVTVTFAYIPCPRSLPSLPSYLVSFSLLSFLLFFNIQRSGFQGDLLTHEYNYSLSCPPMHSALPNPYCPIAGPLLPQTVLLSFLIHLSRHLLLLTSPAFRPLCPLS